MAVTPRGRVLRILAIVAGVLLLAGLALLPV